MIKKLFVAGIVLGVPVAIALWFLSAPSLLPNDRIVAMENGSVEKGQAVFWAGGCTSCHAKVTAKGDEKLKLAGGLEFKTPFGTFVAPNISPDEKAGIGSWSTADFANAMLLGTTPDGSHYYPAFPYTSYSRMSDGDVSDLWAYMQTLPKVSAKAPEHDVSFPFNIRRGLGLWKLLYLKPDPVASFDNPSAQLQRGQYLVEGPGHCGECHTPRNPVGGHDLSRWLAGGPAPEGKGKIPNITPHDTGIGNWSQTDIAYSLETGFTPEFDSFGSSMADVQENTSKLSKADREAIALYLTSIKAVATTK